jgi:hypothetical protein
VSSRWVPDGEGVTVCQGFEATGEGRALRRGPEAAVGENLCAAGPLQRLQLHVGVLVDGRDARVAAFHAGNMTLQTCNSEVPDLLGFLECVKTHT